MLGGYSGAICYMLYVRSETICLRLQRHRSGKDVLACRMDMKSRKLLIVHSEMV